MAVDLDFLVQWFGPVTGELGRLLGVNFVPDNPVTRTPIGWAVQRIIDLQNQGEIVRRDTQLTRLRFLTQHLGQIETHDPLMLDVFRRKLLDPNLGNFFGARAEVSMAASLIRSKVRFVRRSAGGPDFLLKGNHKGLGIESASAHMVNPASGLHVVDKLHAVVKAKSQKPYALPTNVLAVDVTNLQAIGIDYGQGALVSDQYGPELATIAAESGFGSLLLFWLQTEVQDNRVVNAWSRYARADSPLLDAQLTPFLDDHFTGLGHVNPSDWHVPYMP